MIKVSVFYPNGSDAKFDMDYYVKSHMPMVQDKCGAALKQIAVEHGLAGGTPGAKPAYLAMGHLYFDSVESFQGSFGPKAQEILADVPNYTNIAPVMQISDVKL